MWQWTFPLFFMVLYMGGVGMANFLVRLAAAKRGEVPLGYFKHMDHSKHKVPDMVMVMGRHYDNQFQLPMLFLITGVLCIHLELFGILEVICAWGFVLSRFLHGLIHLGTNHVLKRAGTFALGWAFILVLWVMIALQTMPMP